MWIDGSRNWDGTGVTSVSTEVGKMLRGAGTRGMGCCGTKVGVVAGVSACMNCSAGGYAWAGSSSNRIGMAIAGVGVEVISTSCRADTGDAAHSHVSACNAVTGFACAGERASVVGRSMWNVGSRDWRGAGIVSAGVESVGTSCGGSTRGVACCQVRAYSAAS